MTTRLTIPFTLLLAAALALAVSLLLSLDPVGTNVTTAVVAFIVCWVLFTSFPATIIPACIVGATIVSVLLGDFTVRAIVLVHLLPLAAGSAALVTRRVLALDQAQPTATPYRIGMLLILVVTGIGAIYGLAAGNGVELVMVAASQIVVIPVYFFITLHSLSTARRRRQAAIIYVVSISVLSALEFDAPGRHGGLLTLLALPPLIVVAGRARGWRRFALAVLCAGLAADVALAAFRGLWVGGAVTVVLMLVFAWPVVIRGLLATCAAAVVGGALILAAGAGLGLLDRFGNLTDAFGRSAGYRAPEAAVGFNVFADRPLFGAGLGQTTPDLYIPGFASVDVGPMYHCFYVLLLANLGLVGLCAVLWPIVGTAWQGLRERDPMPVSFAAMTCGFLVTAIVEGPTDGHWELGLLPALILLTRRHPPVRPALPVPADRPTGAIAGSPS